MRNERSPPPTAARWIPSQGDAFGCALRVRNEWKHDTLSSSIQRELDIGFVTARNANPGRAARSGGTRHHGMQILRADWAMLEIDNHEVRTRGGERLRCDRGRNHVDEAGDVPFSRPETLLDGPHDSLLYQVLSMANYNSAPG